MNTLLRTAEFDSMVYLLLCGGDKASQQRDIRRAKRILKMLRVE